MRLGTGSRNSEAFSLDRSLGLRMCAPYQEVPEHLCDLLQFMEAELSSAIGCAEQG
jgi:hypothetical protein